MRKRAVIGGFGGETREAGRCAPVVSHASFTSISQHFPADRRGRHGSGDYFHRAGPVQLLGVPGSAEGPGDDPLRTQLLPGMHRGLLEPGQAEEPVQLPPVPPGVQPQTAAQQKHGARRSRGEVPPVWASGAATGGQSQGGEVHRVLGKESHGRPLLPDVRAVVLRASSESARLECPREGPQARCTRGPAG